MDIKTATTEKLESTAYKILVEIEKLQTSLRLISEELKRRESLQPTIEVKKETVEPSVVDAL